MLATIEGAPRGVIALKAVGKVTAADYQTVLRPAVERATSTGGVVRLVYELGPEYEGYTPGAAWEDMRYGIGDLSAWERCAVVTDHHLLADAVRAFGFLLPGVFKVFPVRELDEALTWASE